MSDKEEIIVFNQVMQVPYNYSAGPVTSRFLTALRDERKILGIRCIRCGKVYVPPRGTCRKCFCELSEWVGLSGSGVIETFTAVGYPEPTQPLDTPYILAVIKLDGADTGFTHLVGEVSEDDIKIGMRVKPVFQEKRKGHILDIKYFRPVRGD